MKLGALVDKWDFTRLFMQGVSLDDALGLIRGIIMFDSVHWPKYFPT